VVGKLEDFNYTDVKILSSILPAGVFIYRFFPNIKDSLKTKITITTHFTAFVTSHGKTKSYLHRFKIIESPDCPCGGGSQTIDHLIRGLEL